VSPPDYRDFLADLIDGRFGSRHAFCQATGVDPGPRSRVFAGRADLSLRALRKVSEVLHARLVIQTEEQARERERSGANREPPLNAMTEIGDSLMTTRDDERFMKQAISLAKKCQPESEKDPYVGAVITTKDGVVLGKGYRGEKKAGDHAELTALNCVEDGKLLEGATVYTTLEPCTTRNRPEFPCAERIVTVGATRVVIGMLDPNQNICGKGVRRAL
jgi:pyrimidine deaminase RibD-like protein